MDSFKVNYASSAEGNDDQMPVHCDTNISLTNGNPYRTSEGVMMNIYATAFRSNQISYGAAKSVLFILVLLVVSFGQMKLTSRKEVTM